MLITLSYAETLNNLQIISTISDSLIKLGLVFLKVEKNRLAEVFLPVSFYYLFNKLPTYRNSSFADVEL